MKMVAFLEFHQLGRRNLVRHLGDKAIPLGEMRLRARPAHQEGVHLVLLDEQQSLDELNRGESLPYHRRPYPDEKLRELDVLLVVMVLLQVDEALADEVPHLLRMDYFQREVAGVNYLFHHWALLLRLLSQRLSKRVQLVLLAWPTWLKYR